MGLFDGTILERPVLCERCKLDVKLCKCPPEDTPPDHQTLKLTVEKRKKGKTVTVVSGFECFPSQLQSVLKQLQGNCGAGGSIANDQIEIQGEHLQRIPGILRELGYKVN